MTGPGQLYLYDPGKIVDLFLHSLTVLRTDDDGLATGHDWADLETCAWLCVCVKTIAAQERNVSDMLLHALAEDTEALLVTAVIPPTGDVVKRWLKAQAEFLKCRLGAL